MLLHLKFIETAKKFRKKIAVYDQATGKDLTYEKMLLASLLLVNKINRFPGYYLGVMIPTSAGCMLTILAALMTGKIPVMINYSTGARENSIYAQEKCGITTIITSKKLLTKINIKPVNGMVFIEDIMKSITITEKMKALMQTKFPVSIIKGLVHHGKPEDTSVILFTSGSEKEPKAVQLSHSNIAQQCTVLPDLINIIPQDIFAAVLPLFHVFGLTTNFWLPMLMGCSVVTHANPLEYRSIVESIKKYRITVLIGTPTFFFGYAKRANGKDLSSLKVAIAGADKVTDNLRAIFKKDHGIDVLEGYGTTETSPVIAVNRPYANRHGSVGQAVPGCQIKIIDRETDELLGTGMQGKIFVKGDLVMKGYLGDIEETSLHIHAGWYDTGDMGFIDDDGYLWHMGRLKRFVKIGGEMVSLVKVEEELSHLLPDDVVCCVVDVPNPIKGSEIVAAITTGEIDQKKIIKQLKKVLPTIAVPKNFHVIEDIPLMGSGKVAFREVEKICRKHFNDKK